MTRILRPLLSGMVIAIAFLHGTTARPLPSTSTALDDTSSLEANNSIAWLFPAASNDSTSGPATVALGSNLDASRGTSPPERRMAPNQNPVVIPTVPLLPGARAGSQDDHKWAYNTYTDFMDHTENEKGNEHADSIQLLYGALVRQKPNLFRSMEAAAPTANYWARKGKWAVDTQKDEPGLDNRMLSAVEDALWTEMQTDKSNRDVESWYMAKTKRITTQGRNLAKAAMHRVRLKMEGRIDMRISPVLGHIPAYRDSAGGQAAAPQPQAPATPQAQAGPAPPASPRALPSSPPADEAEAAVRIYDARHDMDGVETYLRSRYPGNSDLQYTNAACAFLNEGYTNRKSSPGPVSSTSPAGPLTQHGPQDPRIRQIVNDYDYARVTLRYNDAVARNYCALRLRKIMPSYTVEVALNTVNRVMDARSDAGSGSG